jgi:hypothetical protein
VAAGLDEVFDERRDKRPGCARACAGGEQVEGGVAREELDRVEVLAGAGSDGV